MATSKKQSVMMDNRSMFYFFWKHAKSYQYYYLILCLAPLTASFYPFVYTYALRLFLDRMYAAESAGYAALLFPMFLFLSAHLFLKSIWQLSGWIEGKIMPYVQKSMLLDMYHKIQHHPYSFFQDHPTGIISNKMNHLVHGYHRLWTEIQYGLGLRLLKSMVNIGALICIHHTLGLCFLSWSLCFSYIVFKHASKSMFFSEWAHASKHQLFGKITDNLKNMATIFAFATHKREHISLERFIDQEVLPNQIKSYQYQIKMQCIAGGCQLLLFVSMLGYMVYLQVNRCITMGTFAQLFAIMLMTYEEIWFLMVGLHNVSHTIGEIRSGLSILDSKPENRLPINQVVRTIQDPSIVLDDIYFGYTPNQYLFKRLHMTIHAGEKIGFVGPSGAGKSSLMHLLLGYFTPQKGTILIGNHNIEMVHPDALKKQIAYIPQETPLFHRTLLENLRYGTPDATDEAVIEACKQVQLHDFIAALPQQYHTDVGEQGIKLSGGQRQRVAIVRAILKNAPILILDEVTSALDSITEQHIQDHFYRLTCSANKTVLAIAHRLASLKYMDRIVVLDHGSIVEQGTHRQLMDKQGSLYQRLWRLQEV